MRLTTILQRSVTLVAAGAVLGACGADPRTETDTEGNPGTVASAAAATAREDLSCLTPADISSLAGLEVRVLQDGTRSHGDAMVCAYETTNTSIGGFVTTVVGPAAQAGEIFDEMRKSAKSLLGPNAEPEAIQLGERGLAYGGAVKSKAAVVSQGRTYYAEITSTASFSIGDTKAAMIEIVRKLMAATESSS